MTDPTPMPVPTDPVPPKPVPQPPPWQSWPGHPGVTSRLEIARRLALIVAGVATAFAAAFLIARTGMALLV